MVIIKSINVMSVLKYLGGNCIFLIIIFYGMRELDANPAIK